MTLSHDCLVTSWKPLLKYKDKDDISLHMQSGVAHLSQALGASPVTFGDIVEGWDQTEGVITVITPITKQESIFITSTPTCQAHVLLHLWGKKQKHCHKRMHCILPVVWKSNGPLTSALTFDFSPSTCCSMGSSFTCTGISFTGRNL